MTTNRAGAHRSWLAGRWDVDCVGHTRVPAAGIGQRRQVVRKTSLPVQPRGGAVCLQKKNGGAVAGWTVQSIDEGLWSAARPGQSSGEACLVSSSVASGQVVEWGNGAREGVAEVAAVKATL